MNAYDASMNVKMTKITRLWVKLGSLGNKMMGTTREERLHVTGTRVRLTKTNEMELSATGTKVGLTKDTQDKTETDIGDIEKYW